MLKTLSLEEMMDSFFNVKTFKSLEEMMESFSTLKTLRFLRK